jgi:RND family efflux transporter MFP subunit
MLVLAAVLGLVGLRLGTSSPQAATAAAAHKEPGVPVTVEYVEPRVVVETIAATGRVEAGQESRLAFEAPGRVAEVLVEEGDEVRAGEVLVRLASEKPEAGREALEEELAHAAEAVATARRRLRDAEALARVEIDPRTGEPEPYAQRVLEDARSALEASGAAERAKRARLSAAEEQVRETVLRSPFASLVQSVLVEAGETVLPGQPAVMLGAMGSRLVRASVSDRSAERIRPGAPAAVTGSSGRVPGAVRKVAPRSERGAVSIEIELPAEAECRLGESVRVEIEASRREAVSLPLEALSADPEATPAERERGCDLRAWVLVEGSGQRSAVSGQPNDATHQPDARADRRSLIADSYEPEAGR